MKTKTTRRGFIGMLGGAFAAPLLPSVSLAAASTSSVAYPASALHAAIYHAQTRVNFSVFALASKLNLNLGQAEALMGDMSKRGIVGPLQGSTQAGRWARSKIWSHPVANTAAASNAARAKRIKLDAAKAQREKIASYSRPGTPWADMRPLMGHLQDICHSHGLALHPRCADLA